MLADVPPPPPAPMTWPYSVRPPRFTPLTPRNSFMGMGQTTTGTQTASQLVSGATGATAGILTALVAATPAALATGIGAAVVGLIALGVAISQMFKGCGQTCVETSNFANQVAAQIQSGFNTYMAAPVHYQSVQTAYLQMFDGAWAQLQQLCQPPSNPTEYGSAGQKCITDRQAGGCTWKVSSFGWEQDPEGNWTYQAAGPNGSGSVCWNWFNGMRDPVANDPTVQPDPAGAADEISSAVTAASTASGLSPSVLLIAGAVILGILLL
jgi:hypothetical protein